jgi:hypothetical protein
MLKQVCEALGWEFHERKNLTLEEVIADAKKYSDKGIWRDKSKSIYKYASIKNMLKQVCEALGWKIQRGTQ